MSGGIPLFVVDAFTGEPFSGNPAAVCFPPEPCGERWMQDVAREMNLSETAFLIREPDCWHLRWFTPSVEVALCGHGTLAAAHVLWESGRIGPESPATFRTKSGLLTARCRGSAIELDFPAKGCEPTEAPPGLADALGVTPRFVGRNDFDYLVEVDSAATVRALKPDHARLAELPVRGVIVTSASDRPEYDFISRFFAPGSGVAEDPVTGSAHCALGPFWKARLNRDEFTAYQASARGGVVNVRVTGDRVFLGGTAVTVLQGELKVASR